MKFFRFALIGLLLLVIVLPLLALQRAPAVAPSALGDDALAAPAGRLLASLRGVEAGGLRRTLLGEAELNALLAQAARGQVWRARAAVGAGTVDLWASAPAPVLPAWLNVRLTWHLHASRPGQLPPLASARLGRLPLPAPWVEAWMLRQAQTRLPVQELLPLVEGWQAETGRLRVDWRWRPDIAGAVAAQTWTPAERRALLLQRRLAQARRDTPSLAPLLQERAQAALAQGEEPAAALKALLVVSSLQTLGRDLAPLLPEAAAWGRLPPFAAQLAQRDDMAQHFLLAALLAWQGGERTAAALGLAKELADRRGGSGFSFNDLAADAAGNRFGRLAAADPAGLLRRLAAGMSEADFFPLVADLPEFLHEQAFRQRYGEVGSPAYQAEIARIDARVAALPLYQGFPGR